MAQTNLPQVFPSWFIPASLQEARETADRVGEARKGFRSFLHCLVAFAIGVIAPLGATRPAYAQTNNLIQDPVFAQQGNVSGEPLRAPWSSVGANDTSSWTGVDVSDGAAYTGNKDAFIYSSGANPWVAITQTVTSGLTPNTNYILTGWINNSNNAGFAGGFFGVKTTSGTVIAQTAIPLTASYTQLTVNFNSGSYTTVVVFAGYTPASTSWMHLDDVSLVNTNLIRDPGLEQQGSVSGEPLAIPWSGVGANNTSSWTGVDVNDGAAHSGTKDGFIYSSGANPWVAITQTVTYGVTPSTNYILTGWINNSNNAGFAGGFFGVKTPSGTVIAQAAVPLTSPYVQLTVNFNSGAYTSLVVFAGYTPGGASWMHLDDVSLAPAPPEQSGPPTISSISPTSGPTSGGMVVTINGSNFESGSTVSFGSINSSAVTLLSSTQINAMAPAEQAGTVSVTITTPDPGSATLPSAFTYTAGPTISGIAPNSGPSTGGTTVTISGTGFKSGATVAFGALFALSVTVNNSTQIEAVTPSESAGTVGVTVTNSDGGSATLTSAFNYVPSSSQAPSISSIVQPSCINTGGCTATINGQNFVSGATVSFGSTPATSVTFVSSSQLTAVVPAGTAETNVNVTVTTPGGTSQPSSFFFGKVVFSNGYESGDQGGQCESATFTGNCFPGWNIAWHTIYYGASIDLATINNNSTFVRSGSYSASFHYTLAADPTGSHRDNDNFTAAPVNPNLSHFFVRGYMYMATPAPGSMTDIDRKIIYPNGAVTNAYFGILGGVGNWMSFGLNDPPSCIQPGDTQISYNLAQLTFGVWHEVELEVSANTPVNCIHDGYANIWFDGSQVLHRTGMNFRGNSNVLISEVSLGDQVDTAATGFVDEYRYWDDVVVADAFIP